MARLNEPPIVGESIEALKRRFMRQNRELAKSNSELRIKVATLESDRSQLLSENITLRDENIHLKQEQLRDCSKRVIENVAKVKDKLAMKVAELAGLMHELETAHAKPIRSEVELKTARRRSFKKSPTHVRQWKSSLHGPEVTGLAPIVEGKSFPRRTLGEDDMQQLRLRAPAVTSSPSPSSSPAAHFDPDEPIVYDVAIPEPSKEKLDNDNECIRGDSPPALFTNLETRRKRRASALIQEPPVEASNKPESPELTKEIQPELALKAGAKRKFGPQDQENETRPDRTDGSSFSFSRKSSTTLDKPANKQPKPITEGIAKKTGDRVRNTAGDVKVRKALGEKMVNTDPIVSPIKSKFIDEKTNNSDLLTKVKDRPRQKQIQKVESIKVMPPPIEIPPTTPASLEHDLFSPTESVASTDAGSSTPLLSELTSKAAENTRPSRRQRVQVSYAEPSLRDKMRRPGKELADAVVVGKSAKEEPQSKTEHAEMPNWKMSPPSTPHAIALPTSPLQNKSSGSKNVLLSPITLDRDRKSTQSDGKVDVSNPKSDTSRTLAAVLVSSHKRLSKLQELEDQISSKDNDVLNSDGSSPENAVQKTSTLLRHSRRHSSMSNIKVRSEAVASRGKVEGKTNGDEVLAGGVARMASRRRSMML